MSKIFIIASVALLALNIQGKAQGFEGTVKFKTENKAVSETAELNWVSKGASSRLDLVSHSPQLPNLSLSFYFIQGQGGIQMVAESGGGKKIYSLPHSSVEDGEFASTFSVEASGKKGNYAGFDCEEYIIRTANTETSCWVSASAGVSTSSLPHILSGKGVFSALQRNGVKGFPLKSTTRDLSGNILMDQEVTSIQAQPVSEGEITLPNYEKGN